MGRLRFVDPEKVRLPLSHGDWIEVKKRLTVGEYRESITSFVGKYNADGSRTPNMELLGMGYVLAYLLAWSFHDKDDHPVPVSLDTLKRIDRESYDEIEKALEAHIKNVETDAETLEKKALASGELASSPTS